MTYLYTEDLAHWNDDLWPTIDPYRMPGTTVDTRRRADIPHGRNYLPSTTWVGGAARDGLCAAGMDLAVDGSTLRARKSWFLLDDSVIALGAGIGSTAAQALRCGRLHLHAANFWQAGAVENGDPTVSLDKRAITVDVDGSRGHTHAAVLRLARRLPHPRPRLAPRTGASPAGRRG